MFDNLFSSSPLTWFALIAGAILVPILIHLINLLRHQKVEWAAMEFLLKSYRKNRNWVRLKQLLLLLSRIAILLLALLMLGQVGCGDNRLSRILGGATTHHYILLDDSFSMSDQREGGSAFDHAKATLSLIAARAKNRQNQLVTLMRYSCGRAPNPADLEADLPTPIESAEFQRTADLSGELVDSLFDQQIEDLKSRLEVSNLNVSLTGVLDPVRKLITERKQENAIVYVLSDFRQKDWLNCKPVAAQLRPVHQAGAAIELIRCTATEHANLAVTALQPVGNVRVAGTPLMMEVTVKNCSSTSAKKIQLKVKASNFVESSSGSTRSSIREMELPTVFIQKIAPGKSETRKFPVFLETVGQQVVDVELPSDAIRIDNRRWCCIDVKAAAKVLILDDSTSTDSRYISLALNPNRMTGIQADVKTTAFLRDANDSELGPYDVIFLLAADSLDEAAVDNLETFVRGGGGLAVFCGPEVNSSFYNASLFRDGTGLLPMPLGTVQIIPELIENRIPDVSPAAHPVFAPVLNVKNTLLELVQVKKIIGPADDWQQTDSLPSMVLATVRGNGKWPLLLEKNFGLGRVALFTSTAGPAWNNWCRNATFPPVLLLLEDHLAAGKHETKSFLAGEPIRVSVPARDYRTEASFRMQLQDSQPSASTVFSAGNLTLTPTEREPDRVVGLIGGRLSGAADTTGDSDTPGVLDVLLTKIDGQQESRRYAISVDTAESDLKLADKQQISLELGPSRPAIVDWGEFNPEPAQTPVSTMQRALLALLVSLLVLEQVAGYSASYHRA